MFDLDTIRYINQQAHLRAVERANNGADEPASVNPATPVFSLATLARQLIIGPPSLAYMVQLFENSEVVATFMEMVSEYLPEREHEIRATDVDQRISLFCSYFELKYFPLRGDISLMDEYSLEEFVSEIPLELMGFSYDDYHEFIDFRTGYMLLLAIIESPFYGEDHGGRVPILTNAAELIGRDVAGVIPLDGWSPDFLHERTDGTIFDGVGLFADWIHSQTDCWVLDANYYDYAAEEWQPNIVAELTAQWPRVCEIQNKIQRVVEFIEENPKQRFIQLLNMLLDINANEYVIPDEQLPLFE